MRTFVDTAGRVWVASAREENTPRHHGRWHLIFHPEDRPDEHYFMPEVRWQTAASAERTLCTMSEFELRRRLDNVLRRAAASVS